MKRSGPIRRRTPLRARSTLRPNASPTRAPMRRSKPTRDWVDARRKVTAEGRCRLCGADGRFARIEAAHTVGRVHDRPHPERGGEALWVDPDDVIPLCTACHLAQHAGEVDLLPVMSLAEQAAAVRKVGIVSAYLRLTGGAPLPTP